MKAVQYRYAVWICDCGRYIETPVHPLVIPSVACNWCGSAVVVNGMPDLVGALADPVDVLPVHHFAQCLN
jgi:hypothetical protein